MKKALLATSLCLIILLCACGATAQTSVQLTPTPTPTDILFEPATSGQQPSAEASPSAASSPSKTNSLYDPSIFVIEASGQWQQELAPGYFANNECELYLNKIDSNDNRQVSGSYQGIFWMKTSLDTSEFISDLLKDVPVDLSFDAGGEAVCDNLGVSLNTTDDKAWTNYCILDENGNPLPLTQDTPVGKGSFVVVSKAVYLEAHGSGAQGETINYSDAKDGDIIDVNYVIHVEPDNMESNSQRKVVIYMSGDGFSYTLEGTMKRLPGYPEDVTNYMNSKEYENSAKRHLNE